MPTPTPYVTPVNLVGAALTAARRGWHVFPLAPGTKRPAISRWEQRATQDPATIRRWWTREPARNIGIACGPSGLLVIDLDAAHGPVPERWARLGVAHGRDVLALLADRAHEPDPVATFTVATPRGGEHRYFLHPTGTRLRSTIGEGGRGLGWRTDTRGPGALIAAAGSIGLVDGHPVPYTIVRDDPVAPLPEWLTLALSPPPPRPHPVQTSVLPPTSSRVRAYVTAAIGAECLAVAAAEEGERHRTVYAAAAALGELVANDWIAASVVTRHLTDAARVHLGVADFDWAELVTTIRDGLAAGRHHPRVLPDRPHP